MKLRNALILFCTALLFVILIRGANAADFGSAMGLYQKGDHVAAHREFSILAEQGNADAQFLLGDMYAKGQGAGADPIQAWKWYELADRNGAQGAAAARDALAGGMSPEDVTLARQQADAWQPTSVATTAAPPPPPPAAQKQSGGFFKNLARTVTGISGGPGSSSEGATAVSGIRGLDAEMLRGASPDSQAVQQMEGYVATDGEATKFAQDVRLAAQNIPYLETAAAASSGESQGSRPLNTP